MPTYGTMSRVNIIFMKATEWLMDCSFNVQVTKYDDIKWVYIYPGSEWDYVILCTVRSRNECDIDVKATADWQERYMGVLTDEQFINMALTRARKGLLIVGKSHWNTPSDSIMN